MPDILAQAFKLKITMENQFIIEHYKKYGVSEGDKLLLETAKNNFQKGQESRNKEILEIIDKWETKQPIDQKYKMEKKGIFYNIYNVSELNLQELKKQLTEEGKE